MVSLKFEMGTGPAKAECSSRSESERGARERNARSSAHPQARGAVSPGHAAGEVAGRRASMAGLADARRKGRAIQTKEGGAVGRTVELTAGGHEVRK